MRRALPFLLLFLASCGWNEVSGPDYPGETSEDQSILSQLELERLLHSPDSVINTLSGSDLREYYFVWSVLFVLHPSGDQLEPWWRYAKIGDALAVIERAYPDPFSFYLPPAYAKIFMEDYEETIDSTVYVEWPTPEVALIQITEFREHSVGIERGDTIGSWSEFRTALEQTRHAEATILDLRGNLGGAVDICTAIADEMVDHGVLYIQRDHWAKIDSTLEYVSSITATAGGMAADRRWVVLQDSLSASCSELLLIALQGNGVGTTVGTTSYGKGIGQTYLLTPLEGLLAVTSLEFFGNDNDSVSYHFFGIEPDHLVEQPADQLARALELALADSSAVETPFFVAAPPPTDRLALLQKQLANRRLSERSADSRPLYRLREADLLFRF